MHLQVEDLLHTKDAFDILYNVVYIKSYCCNKKLLWNEKNKAGKKKKMLCNEKLCFCLILKLNAILK